MERNKTIDIPNHRVGQKMKKGTPESIFFPVKNVAAFKAKVIQHKIDSKDIDTGCHSNSYFEVSLKYADMQKKNATDISAYGTEPYIFGYIHISYSYFAETKANYYSGYSCQEQNCKHCGFDES